MFATIAFTLFAVAVLAWLVGSAIRDHRAALAARSTLLDGLVPHFSQGRIAMAPDGFPTFTGRLPDRREIFVELIPDTMVVRRLPQLWLSVTLRERVERPRASIGALSRPTGAEFYSRVQAFPERVDLPGEGAIEILVRGDGRLASSELASVATVLTSILADWRNKEVAGTPRGVRLVRQAAEGERGAHLLLRQIKFGMAAISVDTVADCIAQADQLRAALDQCSHSHARLSA